MCRTQARLTIVVLNVVAGVGAARLFLCLQQVKELAAVPTSRKLYL